MRIATTVLSVFAVVVGTFSGSSAAFAASPPTAPVLQDAQAGMQVTGFDEAVAKAHGYHIVTYVNGDQQSVPIDPQSDLPKGPILPAQSAESPTIQSNPVAVAAANTDYNQVQGNCGISWIRVTETGAHKVSIASGYKNLAGSAYYWEWDVQLTDKNGSSHQRYSGATSGTAASRVWSNLNQYSWTYDFVSLGGAVLNNGTICTSGRPDVYISGL